MYSGVKSWLKPDRKARKNDSSSVVELEASNETVTVLPPVKIVVPLLPVTLREGNALTGRDGLVDGQEVMNPAASEKAWFRSRGV